MMQAKALSILIVAATCIATAPTVVAEQVGEVSTVFKFIGANH